MIKVKDSRSQVDALGHLLTELSSKGEGTIDIAQTARKEVSVAVLNKSGKVKGMHYVKQDGCIQTAWYDDREEGADAQEES